MHLATDAPTFANHPVTWSALVLLTLALVVTFTIALRQRAARRSAQDDARREAEARRHAEALVEEARRLREQEERLAAEAPRPSRRTTDADGWGVRPGGTNR